MRKLWLAGLCLSLVAAAVTANDTTNAAAPAYYDVSFQLEQHGQAMGQPRLLLEPGEPAEIRVEKGDSDNSGYRLRVVASPAPAADGTPRVALSLRLYRFRDGGWQLDSTPEFTVAPGKPATAHIGDRRGGKPPELSVTVTATPLTERAYEKLRAEMEEGDTPSH